MPQEIESYVLSERKNVVLFTWKTNCINESLLGNNNWKKTCNRLIWRAANRVLLS